MTGSGTTQGSSLLQARWSGPYKVARLEQEPAVNGLHLVGKQDDRECGCTAVLGMRLDVQEPTFGLIPCAEHEAACERALAAWRAMPPSEREVFELMEELLDREVGVLS